jgi:hypothetical protein
MKSSFNLTNMTKLNLLVVAVSFSSQFFGQLHLYADFIGQSKLVARTGIEPVFQP